MCELFTLLNFHPKGIAGFLPQHEFKLCIFTLSEDSLFCRHQLLVPQLRLLMTSHGEYCHFFADRKDPVSKFLLPHKIGFGYKSSYLEWGHDEFDPESPLDSLGFSYPVPIDFGPEREQNWNYDTIDCWRTAAESVNTEFLQRNITYSHRKKQCVSYF